MVPLPEFATTGTLNGQLKVEEVDITVKDVENAGTGARQIITEKKLVGDLLLMFGNGGATFPSRTADRTWQSCRTDERWNLTGQTPVIRWSGFPFSYLECKPWHIWIVGEFYGTAVEGADFERVLFQILDGDQNASKINGHLLIFAWNPERKEWHILTDRFGTVHGYYCVNDGQAAIGTFFPSVASISNRKLDWDALTAFFSFGFFPSDRTYFTDVKILEPASRYVFDEFGQLKDKVRYWNWAFNPNFRRSYSDTVDEFGLIFNKVIHEHCSDARVAMPISGGLDSRSAIAALQASASLTPRSSRPAQNSPLPPLDSSLWFFSYGYSDDSIETQIARDIAGSCGFPIDTFTIGEYLFDEGALDNITDNVDGFQDVTQCRQAYIAEELSRKSDYVLAAHWGDVWMDSIEGGAEHGARCGEVELVLGKTLKEGRGWLVENLCRPKLGGESKGQGAEGSEKILTNFVAEGLERVSHIEDADFRVKAYKTDSWSFRWTLASLRSYQPGAFPRLPFYDTRLTDFLSTVPMEYLTGRRLQIDYIKRFAPRLAKVKWQAYDADLHWSRYFNSLLVPKRALKKARRILGGQTPIQRNWEVQFLSERGRKGLEDNLVKTGLKLHEFIPPKKILGLLNDFYDDPYTGKKGYTVAMLLTFSAWLEKHG